MLDLWRPPHGAGDPIGCLATTYTFAASLFDEQCLARFLEIESEPSREDLAFLLERESRLGSVYAGIMVDYTQAGVEHSLRWDVLPVRIHNGKQHAKISLLAWSRHVRIIIASANLTEPGYRTNFEVAAAVDLTPDEANHEIIAGAAAFLKSLLDFVPGASDNPPEVRRAEAFLDQADRLVRGWKPSRRRETIRQQLVFTLPPVGAGGVARSSLEEAVQACRKRGGSPDQSWIASPFFDMDEDTSRVTASLCKLMARGGRRDLYFCVPAIRDDEARTPRLAAPKSLLLTPPTYQGNVSVEILPDLDDDKNRRPWHAKMLALIAQDQYSALMVGSSNFTCAGMGVGAARNAEANLLTIATWVYNGRETGKLEEVWPETEKVNDPESVEWLGANPGLVEEEQTNVPKMPSGFLSAMYRAGDKRQIVLRFDPKNLPKEWHLHACGQEKGEILSSSAWEAQDRPAIIQLDWKPVQPPEKLLVRWGECEAFMPLNVEDSRELLPPVLLEKMSADDMLCILAASDPSAAFRAWARRESPADLIDDELDSATPIDLDPLRRYDLQATFLHRVARRARVLAQLRSNLQRPVCSKQALEWRLRGLIGIEQLADRLVRECSGTNGNRDEALLTLADFLIVLLEVDYRPTDGFLPKAEFNKVFRPFLSELVDKLDDGIRSHRDNLSAPIMEFWAQVVQRCRE